MRVDSSGLGLRILLVASVWLWQSQWEAAAEPSAGGADYALTLYYGRLTHHDWLNTLFSSDSGYVHSYLVVAALDRTVYRSDDLPLTFEVEGQMAKHYGEQDNWEFNLVAAGRWHRFPWNEHVRTTAAFGLGPSYAISRPKFEVANRGSSQRLLAYWYLELTLGPPRADWSVSFRLHHRSTAFGTFGGAGGYNALAVGLRYLF